MSKPGKQRSAEFRARKAQTPEVRGIFAPPQYHDELKAMLAHYWGVTIATKRGKK